MDERRIEYFPEVGCDMCEAQGAYLVDGDFLCAYCLNACVEAEDVWNDEEDYF